MACGNDTGYEVMCSDVAVLVSRLCHTTALHDLSHCVYCFHSTLLCIYPLLPVRVQLFKNLESYWDKLFKQVKDEKGTCEVCGMDKQ